MPLEDIYGRSPVPVLEERIKKETEKQAHTLVTLKNHQKEEMVVVVVGVVVTVMDCL